MGIAYNPKIVTDGLAMYLDATNINSCKGQRSIISWDSWAIGSGGTTGYSANGDGNSRLSDTAPFGTSDIVWDVSNQDASSDADGGWDGNWFTINTSKMYRFSVWMRRKTIGNGYSYLGTNGFNPAQTNIGVLNRSNGAVNTNPYWVSHVWWGNANQWYLLVGHVWPEGSGTGASHAESGIYDTSGNKVASTNGDFVWQTGTVWANHRSYLYYSTDVTTNQQWYQPRVDIFDGSQPTLSDIFNNVGNKWYDLSSNGRVGTLNNKPVYTSGSAASFTFNGTNNSVNIPSLGSYIFGNNPYTLSFWLQYSSGNTQPARILEKVGTGRVSLIYYAGNKVMYQGYNGTSWDTGVISTSALNLNTWYNICVTKIGTTPTIYINGVSNATGIAHDTYNDISGTGYLASEGGSSNFFVGKIGLVSLYNRYLLADEVAQNFRAVRGRYGV